jgi:hypothetical protein
MAGDKRPIERRDFDRLYSVVYAVRAYLDEGDYVGFAESLELCQGQANIEAGELREEAGTTEQYVKHELTRAALLISAVAHGEGEVPARLHESPGMCSVPGCHELTDGGLDECLDHHFQDDGS